MRNKRTILIAFLLISTLALGIGYANLTDYLEVSGTADITKDAAENTFNEDVYFKTAVANEVGNTASVNADNKDKASFTVNTLTDAAHKATFTFTIYNDSEQTVASVTPTVSTNNTTGTSTYVDSLFTVTTDWDSAKTINPKQEVTITVTVSLDELPSETIHGDFTITLTATNA